MTNIPPAIRFAEPANKSRSVASLGLHQGTLTSITVWHDYLCPWCYVGLIQVEKLKKEFGVTVDWRGAELMPISIPHTPRPPQPPKEVDPNEPPAPPSRFDLFLKGEGIVLPSPRPAFTRTHNALLATEYATVEHGVEAGDAFLDATYRAFWERTEDIADHAVLAAIAERVGLHPGPLVDSVVAERYNENIVEFDDDAYGYGVRHVPTFVFGAEERLAEAPYSDLAHATERFLVRLERWKGK